MYYISNKSNLSSMSLYLLMLSFICPRSGNTNGIVPFKQNVSCILLVPCKSHSVNYFGVLLRVYVAWQGSHLVFPSSPSFHIYFNGKSQLRHGGILKKILLCFFLGRKSIYFTAGQLGSQKNP